MLTFCFIRLVGKAKEKPLGSTSFRDVPVVAQFFSVRISRTARPKSESLSVSQLSMSHEDDFA